MSGYEWSEALLGKDITSEKGRQPFHDVYFTGMVRDNKRRKMSKSLGNSPDALKLIENYGADGVRFGMMASAAAGNDIIFDAPFDAATKAILNESKLCEQGRNFCNKLWNALRLLRGWEVSDEITKDKTAAINNLAGRWLSQKWSQTLAEMEAQFETYRLSEAIMTLYKFIWDDFCSWYLEMIKPAYGEPIDRVTLTRTTELFSQFMTVLHPFMPFVTEEIWQQLVKRLEGEDCIISEYPKAENFDKAFIENVERAKEIVTAIREVRSSKGLKMKDELKVFAQDTPKAQELLAEEGLKPMLIKMANLSELSFTQTDIANSVSFLIGTEKFYVEMEQTINVEEERQRLNKDLVHYQGFIQSVQKKLSNEKFVNGAPANVIEIERKKLADSEEKIKSLEEALAQLN